MRGEGGGLQGVGGGQGGCEQRSEVFVKIKKNGGGGGGGRAWGGLCWVELGGGGVGVDVNEELKFL